MSRRTPPHWFLVAAVVQAALAFALFAVFWHPADVLTLAAQPDAEVTGREPVRWTFNLVARSDEPPAKLVALSPALPGTWSWEDDRTLSFVPLSDWPAATRFQATLAKDLWRTPQGFHLAADLTTTFATPAPSFLVAKAAAYSSTVFRWILIADQPLSAARLAGLVTMTIDGARLTPALSDHEGSIVLTVTGDFDAKPAMIDIAAGARAAHGDRPTASATQIAVWCGHRSALVAAVAEAPLHGQGSVRLIGGPGSADLSGFADRLGIEPQLPVETTVDHGAIVLRGAFVPGRSYRITSAAVWPAAGDDHLAPDPSLPADTGLTITIPRAATGGRLLTSSEGLVITLDHLLAAELHWLDADGNTIATTAVGATPAAPGLVPWSTAPTATQTAELRSGDRLLARIAISDGPAVLWRTLTRR